MADALPSPLSVLRSISVKIGYPIAVLSSWFCKMHLPDAGHRRIPVFFDEIPARSGWHRNSYLVSGEKAMAVLRRSKCYNSIMKLFVDVFKRIGRARGVGCPLAGKLSASMI
jgi:hypothetical protein